jgi:hypothetical protein
MVTVVEPGKIATSTRAPPKGVDHETVSNATKVLFEQDKETERLALASFINTPQIVKGTSDPRKRKHKQKVGTSASKLSLKKQNLGLNKEHRRQTLPLALYTSGDKQLRERFFPCPCCLQPADGSHQCGGCFTHVHQYCASVLHGSSDGFGEMLACGLCNETYEEETATQLWPQNDTEEAYEDNETGNLDPESKAGDDKIILKYTGFYPRT